MMQPPKVARPPAVYFLTGLMLLIAVAFGGFFAVWCGTLRFIFSGTGWRAFALLIVPGFIAWRAFDAARDAWDGLPSAPVGAAVTLLAVAFLIALAQIDAFVASHPRFIAQLIKLRFSELFADLSIRGVLIAIGPHAVLFGLIALVFHLSPQFDQHRFEAMTEYEDVPTEAANDNDNDDDMLFLGGA